jgi:tetratricopeptide (TPR) repeat protein
MNEFLGKSVVFIFYVALFIVFPFNLVGSILRVGLLWAMVQLIVYDKTPNSALEYERRGCDRYDAKDYLGAMADFIEVIRLSPNSNAYYNLGLCYTKLGHYEKAIANYSQAIKLLPYNIHAFQQRARAFFSLGNHVHAIEDCNYALEINRHDFEAHNIRAYAKSYSGDLQGAIEDFSHTLRLYPSAHTYCNLGITQWLMEKRDEALDNLSKAIIQDSRFPSSNYLRGNVYYDSIR